MGIYIACEDLVTELIIKRLIGYCLPEAAILGKLPARGGEMKNKKKIESFNKLANENVVVYLIDLDASDCAPILKNTLLENIDKNENYIFNVAVDEAESWLMADRENFAMHFGIPIDVMPFSKKKKYNGRQYVVEVDVPCKPSLYITERLAKYSTKAEVRAQLLKNGDACKGKEYNTAMIPFIKTQWKVEEARKNSDSLERMIARLDKLREKM